MTTLKNFVSEALVQFLSGIQAAQQDPDVGKYVSPRIYGGDPKLGPSHPLLWTVNGVITTMKFDIAVTADSSSSEVEGGSAKAGLSVLDVGISAKLEGTEEHAKRFENVSRVQFAVHVTLPQAKEEKA